jgi:hypothetical protein
MTPSAILLEALAAWLRDDLQPELTGVRAFENRIAVNLLAILRREQELSTALQCCEASIAAERGLPPQDLPSALARGLRDGEVSADAQLLEALRKRAMLRCTIDGPRYPGLEQARRRWPALAAARRRRAGAGATGGEQP